VTAIGEEPQMPIDDPPADRRPQPSGPAGQDSAPTDADAEGGRAASPAIAPDVTAPAVEPAGPSGPNAAAEPSGLAGPAGPSEPTEPTELAGQAESSETFERAEAPDATSHDGSDDRGPLPPSGPGQRDTLAGEPGTRPAVGRPARFTPSKPTPVKATPLRTTPIKPTPVVAVPIKPFPIKANQTAAAPVKRIRGQVPQTRSPRGRGRTPDASPAVVPTSDSAGEATAAAADPTPPQTSPTPADLAGSAAATSDLAANAAATLDTSAAPTGTAPSAFARGMASIDWHPPMVDPPAAAAVSPAPLGFVAPGTMFGPPRHAAQPGRRTALLVTTSALAVLFLLMSAGFAFAFVNRNNAYHKQVTTVTQRNATIATNQSQINDLKSKLAAAQAQAQQLQNQIADSAGQVTELQQEKTVLGTCINSINNFFTVVGENGTSAEQSTAQTTMETDCNAAQKYLN
jgi:hypothetical protein